MNFLLFGGMNAGEQSRRCRRDYQPSASERAPLAHAVSQWGATLAPDFHREFRVADECPPDAADWTGGGEAHRWPQAVPVARPPADSQ